jgi:hypothetical protein
MRDATTVVCLRSSCGRVSVVHFSCSAGGPRGAGQRQRSQERGGGDVRRSGMGAPSRVRWSLAGRRQGMSFVVFS